MFTHKTLTSAFLTARAVHVNRQRVLGTVHRGAEDPPALDGTLLKRGTFEKSRLLRRYDHRSIRSDPIPLTVFSHSRIRRRQK